MKPPSLNTKNIEAADISNTHHSIMKWSIKTSTLPPTTKRDIYIIFLGIPLAIGAYITWRMRNSLIEDFDLWLSLCLSLTILGIIPVAMFMQKTAFDYIIHPDRGEVEHQLYFPNFAGGLFKGVATVAILMFVGAAILTGSLLFLFGPAAVAVGSAMKLMNWEKPPVEKEKSMPWRNHHFVTVDRKYLIIVVHTTDITTGFKARFPNTELFEQYLAFLYTAVAPNAEFTEKVWEW
ncbi:permease [Pseudomonas syringae]|nr:permease [Pseudomonas syringae]